MPAKSRRTLPSFRGVNGIEPLDHIGLVISIAKRYGAKHPIADSEQYALGCVGLMKAADRFDHTRGFAFATYATHWIRQAITRPHFMSLTAKNGGGRKPFVASTLNGVGGKPIGDNYAVEPSLTFDLATDMEELTALQDTAAKLLAQLPERYERIARRYFMDGLTLEEVGNEEGITRERVRQLTVKCVARMRRYAERTGLQWSIQTMELMER